MAAQGSHEALKHSHSKSSCFLIHTHFFKPCLSNTAKSKGQKVGVNDELCGEECEELEEELDDSHILYRTNISSNKRDVRPSKNSYRPSIFAEIYISPLLRPPRS